MATEMGTHEDTARAHLSASGVDAWLRKAVLASMVAVAAVIAVLSIPFGAKSTPTTTAARPVAEKPSRAVIQAYRRARIIDAAGSCLTVPHIVDNIVVQLGRVGWLTDMKNTLVIEVRRLDGVSGYGWVCPEGLSVVHDGNTERLPFRGLASRDGIRVLVFGEGLDSNSMNSFEADKGTRLAASILLPKETNFRLDIEFGDEVIENN